MAALMRRAPALTLIVLFAVTALGTALAHHGWSWTEDGFFELRGTVKSVSVSNPHAIMEVHVNGDVWRVELAPPARTIRAGFTAETAKPGDEVTAIGNRSQDEGELRMKAVRVIAGGQTYDVYPNRVPAD